MQENNIWLKFENHFSSLYQGGNIQRPKLPYPLISCIDDNREYFT